MVRGIVSLGVYIGQFRPGPIRGNHGGAFWIGRLGTDTQFSRKGCRNGRENGTRRYERERGRSLGLEREMGVRIRQSRRLSEKKLMVSIGLESTAGAYMKSNNNIRQPALKTVQHVYKEEA